MNNIEICKKFASDHSLIFEEEGQCGFGRECVGFISKSGNWLDHNPLDMETYDVMDGLECDDLYAPEDVESYHKHDCIAVLGRGESAILGLAKWVKKIEALGNVRVVEYKTGSTGIQAIISGATGYAIMAGE